MCPPLTGGQELPLNKIKTKHLLRSQCDFGKQKGREKKGGMTSEKGKRDRNREAVRCTCGDPESLGEWSSTPRGAEPVKK